MIAWDHRCNAALFGFVGGLAINVLRLYSISNQQSSKDLICDWIYWGQFFGLAIIGAFVALARDLSSQITPMDAFNAGVAIPALIKAGADAGVKRRKRKTD